MGGIRGSLLLLDQFRRETGSRHPSGHFLFDPRLDKTVRKIAREGSRGPQRVPRPFEEQSTISGVLLRKRRSLGGAIRVDFGIPRPYAR